MTHCKARQRTHPCGLTLVELLVVIGIIAVLIGILMPTISRVNASARRTACLSNLRQVYQLFVLYAMDNADQVPLACRFINSMGQPVRQYNSMVYSATSRSYVLFGLLYRAGFMRTPQAFYCPAENDPQSSFNTPANPWPPGPDGDATRNVYSGYACRPEVAIPDEMATAAPMPKLTRFRNRAILSDVTTAPARVLTRHGTGINVLYGDGAARWVDYKVFKDELAFCQLPPSPAYNDHQYAIWQKLDLQ